MEDRSWAVGLSQPEFERAYLQRWPGADVIPLGEEWVHPIESVSRLIDAPDLEKFETDGPRVETDKRKIPKQFICPGCNRVFEFNVTRAGHQRGCAKYKALKAQEEALA